MLRKLKIQFIAITMVLVGVVLIAVLGSTYYSSYSTQMSLTQEGLDRALMRRDGKFPRFGGEDRGPADGMMMLTVSVDADSNIMLESSIPGITVDAADIADIVDVALASESESGFSAENHLAWKKSVSSDGSFRLAIADTSMRDAALDTQALTSVGVFIGAMVLVFLLAWALSKWALAPVEQAWDKQRRFIADASHELKTPLTVILANSQILANDKELPSSSKQWVERTQEEAQHMNELVGELLELARADDASMRAGSQALTKSDVNLSQLASSAALEFDAVAFERGCTIEERIAPDIHTLGDATTLNRAFKTLIDNATKYASTGSVVLVSLEQSGKQALFQVTNQGPDIDPEDLKHLFDRFYRSDEARERQQSGGFGLGLAIAKSIVETHGGTIDAVSQNGSTTFSIRL